MKIFISYRRDDSAAMAGRMFDRLASQFGRENVFMDVDTIPFGMDFRQHISDAIGQCDAVLAVIGEKWTKASQNQKRRLDDPTDFVRVELETALNRNTPVIPVLVGQTFMPSPSDLPPSLEELAYRNAIEIDVGRDFHMHMDRLIRALQTLLSTSRTNTEMDEELISEQNQEHVTPAELKNACITLQVEERSGTSRTQTFYASNDRRIIIGRGSECDLRVLEVCSSRKHAMIIYDLSRGWMLQDLNSRNGVILNNTIVEKMGLKVGDRIRIGLTEIVVHSVVGPPSVA